MIDILVLGLVIISLYNIQCAKPFSSLNNDYLSPERCRSFRGIFALVIIFHHMAQWTLGGILFHKFVLVGYLPVAVFFFYSGYGLMKKHMLSPNYRKNFLLNRIPSVLLPYFVITVLYWLFFASTGAIFNGKEILTFTFIKGQPIVSNSWYVLAIVIFYLFFWILMTLFKHHCKLMLISSCFLCIVYIWICRYLNYELHWYNSVFAFPVGMFWAYYESDIFKLLERHFPVAAISVTLLWIIFFLNARHINFSVKCILLQNISACLFSILVVLFSMKFRIRSKIARSLGTISFELYMLHGLPMMAFRNENFFIQNELLWCSLVLSTSVILAIVFHFLFNKLLTCYRRLIIK